MGGYALIFLLGMLVMVLIRPRHQPVTRTIVFAAYPDPPMRSRLGAGQLIGAAILCAVIIGAAVALWPHVTTIGPTPSVAPARPALSAPRPLSGVAAPVGPTPALSAPRPLTGVAAPVP
jgi:hypothetical protein